MRTELLIGGNWGPGSDGHRIIVSDPATGDEVASVAAGSPEDISRACDAAAAAQPRWAAVAPRTRSEILRSCWQTMIDHTDELAEMITSENGKPLVDARGEVIYAAEFFRWNAEEAVRIHGSLGIAPSGGNRILVRHPPVGVVVMITPWNFPAAMITRKAAPAIAAGNAVVIKPPSETPLTALRVADLMQQAGLPPGVVNVVPTRQPAECYDAAVDHPATRMVSFTGSTATGRRLLRRASDRVLKTTMELGGNAPFIVFDDADLDAAVAGAMTAKMRHSAQTCTAANRFFAETGVADEFIERLATAMGALTVGNGRDEEVDCGPMITSAAIDKIDELVKEAVGAGAHTAIGGTPVDGPGNFYQPTVLGGVAADSPITQHEIFGPIAPVIAFTDHEEVVDWANDTEMGLAAYVYSVDLAKALHTGERLAYGMVGINRGAMSDPAAPFGGMKQSGLGREGAADGIYEFCETQYIAAQW